jgi:deoxyhypusine synthase
MADGSTDINAEIRKSLFKASVELGTGKIEGYNFEGSFDAAKFFDSYKDIGFQATNLGKAIDLIKKMRSDGATIFFGFTSNVTTSGLRDMITYLVKNKLVHFLVTTTGGLEEDIMKTHGNFLHGAFEAEGSYLRELGVNRTGDIFIPNERYVWFETFMAHVLKDLYAKQKETGKLADTVSFVKQMGLSLESLVDRHKESFTYWCYKNDIPLLCTPLNDGATGDNIYLFKKDHPDFDVTLARDVELLYETVMAASKCGAIIIGGSVPKHHIMMAMMLRDGADYTVYINTGVEQDGSNGGASTDEAKSWGKVAPDDNNIKVWGDATIIFPIIIAAAFKG